MEPAALGQFEEKRQDDKTRLNLLRVVMFEATELVCKPAQDPSRPFSTNEHRGDNPSKQRRSFLTQTAAASSSSAAAAAAAAWL